MKNPSKYLRLLLITLLIFVLRYRCAFDRRAYTLFLEHACLKARRNRFTPEFKKGD